LGGKSRGQLAFFPVVSDDRRIHLDSGIRKVIVYIGGLEYKKAFSNLD